MTRLEQFKECLKGPWNNTSGKVSWKIVNGVMYLQCTKEKEDWYRNLSIVPAFVKIQGVEFFIPVGLEASWEEMKPIIKANPCDAYVGYSLGAEIASLASAYTGKCAVAFACPNFFIGGKKAVDLFEYVEFATHDKDYVVKLPTGYRKGKHDFILKGKVIYDPDMSFIEKLSGHTPTAYKQLLGGAHVNKSDRPQVR